VDENELIRFVTRFLKIKLSDWQEAELRNYVRKSEVNSEATTDLPSTTTTDP
jgi:hypothetical protein